MTRIVPLRQMPRLARAFLADPLGFRVALDHLDLAPQDLPSLHREARLDGCMA